MPHTKHELPPMTTVPCLIYDGDCGICAWWVRYWQRLTGDKVRYAAYQDAGDKYPEIARSEFEKAIHYLPAKGLPAKGAHAAFRVLAHAPGHGLGLWLYQHLPGFAPVSQFVYRKVAANRPWFARLSWFALGRRELQPRTHEAVSDLFLRLLGLILLAAFVSFGIQAQGLIGSQGILPAAEFFPRLVEQLGYGSIHRAPSLFWFYQADWFIWLIVLLGGVAAGFVVARRYTAPALLVAYLSYLSIVHAGRVFMTFQWDILLLEMTLLAILLAVAEGRWRTLVIWGFRWLLFRFVFLSGVVKIASGDPAWQDFSALDYHFETQPLPTLLAWYAHHLPDGLLAFGTAATLVIELLIGFLLFAPRRIRFFAMGSFALLQLVIIATGNYNFFNLLSLVLCLTALDDQALSRFRRSITFPAPTASSLRQRIAGSAVLVLLLPWFALSAANTLSKLGLEPAEPLQTVIGGLQPFAVGNNYGPFAVMTRERNELEFQGSMDAVEWKSYRFHFKPDRDEDGLPWIIPHQPRLDWQLWFAVLGPPQRAPWLNGFVRGLFENRAPVTGLLAENPFADQPPRFLRVNFRHFRFTSPMERKSSGNWWQSETVGVYLGPISNPNPPTD